MTYWETADIFGDCRHSLLLLDLLHLTRTLAEKLIGQWFEKTGRRAEIFLGTCYGSFDPEKPDQVLSPDSSPANIHKVVTRSLRALNTDYIDLYTQGRVDPNVPIEVVLKALGEYIDKGMIRWIGLSECSAEVLRRAKAVPGVGKKVIAVQREFSPFELGIEKDGFLQCAKELGVTVVVYSPFGRGLATGRRVQTHPIFIGKTPYLDRRFRSHADFEQGDLRAHLPRFSEENISQNLELVDKLKAIGDKYNVSSPRVILAWMLAEHDNRDSALFIDYISFLLILDCSYPPSWMSHCRTCRRQLERS